MPNVRPQDTASDNNQAKDTCVPIETEACNFESGMASDRAGDLVAGGSKAVVKWILWLLDYFLYLLDRFHERPQGSSATR
jgi:hypothetical protein